MYFSIADGMISTNWISGFLIDVFGDAYLSNGSLRTKYIKPILENQIVIAALRVAAVERADGETRYTLDVWCEDDKGQKLTVGAAEVRLPV